MSRHAYQLGLTLAGLLVLVVLWQLGIWQLQQKLPLARLLAPVPALETLIELVTSGEILGDVAASLRRVLVSLSLALLAGIPVGLAVGFWRRFDSATSGAFQFLRMISPLSWMPIAIMIFGIGDQPVYFLLCMGAVWPIILNTAAGVRNLDPGWLMLAQSMSASRLEMLLRVVLPGILGSILTGTRLAIGMIWVLLVPCEMLGVTSGLGYFILDTRDRLAYSELMAVIVLIGILGYLLDSLARSLQRRWA
ncbi:MAG: ABC transporter permease [Pseudomonas sp.]|uniref:ABC transporter permease n=1 Tax=Denitrificimonas caeni TaxID=521720 RepID=UPI0016BA9BD6|nr:ABC transporter permease [Denitrificimonas caeni]MCK9533070.1 ABC transporter permease [Pseudomonas sp.]MDD2223289.1 ABC transporter permease [Pseudomonas sp.]MDY0415020.1 ABC transporter permease [Pseudomonas sp.]NLO53189.1 ABC transporter permease [Gammaproteobacteria bacterium]